MADNNTPLPPLKNQTWDDQDTGAIQYAGDWYHAGTYNASNTHQTGTLSSTDDVNANITFIFPRTAYGFYYYGMRRSQGANYKVCVDCDPNNPQWQDIPNTHNATDDGRNPPVVLFAQTWPTADVHKVVITNRPDPAFNHTSQLTIDRIALAVEDDSAPRPVATSSVAPPSSSSASSSTSTSTSSSSPTASTKASGAAELAPSANPSKTALIGGIIGGIAVAIVLFIALILAFIYMRRRRRAKKAKQAKVKLEEEFHSRGDDLAFTQGSKNAAFTIGSPPISSQLYNPGNPPDLGRPLDEKLRPFGDAPIPLDLPPPPRAPPSAEQPYSPREKDQEPRSPEYEEEVRFEDDREYEEEYEEEEGPRSAESRYESEDVDLDEEENQPPDYTRRQQRAP